MLVLTLVAVGAWPASTAAQSARAARIVFEPGVGGGRHQPTRAKCEGAVDPIATVAGHLAAGAAFGPRLAAYLTYDTGAVLNFGGGGGGDGYGYSTAFAEIASRSAPQLALRVGAGQGDGTADRGSLYGRGVIARGGLGLRTR